MIGFGFRLFANYRIRVLLYAGKPNGTYSPRSHPAEIRRATKGGEHAAFSAEKVLASHGNPGSLRSIDWIESDSHEPVVCDELEIIV